MNARFILLLLFVFISRTFASGPKLLDDQFELPPGFHIYRAADAELSGGSYDLAFDGQGRLLVGDGNAVRRLKDKDGDGVYDGFEVIATDLGWRGPQGLLVYGDKLYAVGGDGLQSFEGYQSGKLTHRQRLGKKLLTGNDHDAHTILRGHDGYLYFIVGNGVATKDRDHITETNSPVIFEREACVYRISPDGKKWECIGAGGRNPPNLGQNYLGDFFSFDSDMEWHLGLPWYRPVRLNHWAIGGDQGWQEVGAYPSYYIDCLPGILEVGRGSPTWGTFYEHNQLPQKYHDSYLVCDYRWKKESNDQYLTTGRLVAFFLQPDNSGSWKASIETLARPRPGARDASGKLINFALVDIEVAPDGSLFLSDHNQGIWRIFYRAADVSSANPIPSITPSWPTLADNKNSLLDDVLTLPQPSSERTRLREEEIRTAYGSKFDSALQKSSIDTKQPITKRLRALRLLSPQFQSLPATFINKLTRDKTSEMRGQAATLIGIRSDTKQPSLLLKLLDDKDAFVRRRAAEALSRLQSSLANKALIKHLGDESRLVRFVAMNALAHRPTGEWFEQATQSNPQIKMRALVASLIRRNPPSDKQVRRVIEPLFIDAIRPLENPMDSTENKLDLLRVLLLFKKTLLFQDTVPKQFIQTHLADPIFSSPAKVRWEQVRLLGEFNCTNAFGYLLHLLESETNHVTQFHLAQNISHLTSGWNPDEEQRLLKWFLSQQHGWFTEFGGKGVEFPDFWMTALNEFGEHHGAALLEKLSAIDFSSQLGSVAVELLTKSPEATEKLISLYHSQTNHEARLKIAKAFKNVRSKLAAEFLREESSHASNPPIHAALLEGLANQSANHENLLLFLATLMEDKNTEVIHACLKGMLHCHAEIDLNFADSNTLSGNRLITRKSLINVLITRMQQHQELCGLLQKTLVTVTKVAPPDYKSDTDPDKSVEEAERAKAIQFWQGWHEKNFKEKFKPDLARTMPEKTDEELHRFILSDASRKGVPARGVKVYESVGCNACHGGGVTPGQEGKIFGPDLAGVTRRLSRQDLADAIVYPSKQIAERFRASEVELDNSTALTGFITEQNNEFVTLVDREQVHRLARAKIVSITAQTKSLMPEHLLNHLSLEEIRDLLAFLEEGAAPKK